MYEAMARRYRPATFEDVVGQEHVAQTLRNAIQSGRVAHAYLFCGPHGCGKTSMARIFARALVCKDGEGVNPCGTCDLCRSIMAGQDVDVQEIDGASNNNVEQVRTLREQASYIPTRAAYKIYIIDEVHMLSVPAFNALLKTLEEPPAHVKFILATTDPHKVPETVLSRTQRFDFRLVPPHRLAAYYKTLVQREGEAISEEAVEAVAAFAGGSVRDGLVLLDQLLSYATGEVSREDVERVRGVAGAEAVAGVYAALQAHDLKAALTLVDGVAQRGVNVGDFLDQLVEFGRDLMTVIATGSDENISVYGPARDTLMRLSELMTLDQTLLVLDVLVDARTRVRSRALTNPLVPLEMAIARLAGLDSLEPVGAILQKLEALSRGAPLPTPSAPVTANPAPAAPVPAAPLQKGISASPAMPSTNTPPTPQPSAVQQPSEQSTASAPAEASHEIRKEDSEEVHQAPPWAGGYEEIGSAELTLEKARELWPAVLKQIEQDKPLDLRFLHDISIRDVNGNIIVLSVPGDGFIFEQLEDRFRKARIVKAATAVMGQDIEIHLHPEKPILHKNAPTTEKKTKPKMSKAVQNRRKAEQDPSVQTILQAFEGQILNIETDE